jgi:ferredoxin
MGSGQVTLTIDGSTVSAPASKSVIEAAWHAGIPQITGIGCLQGTCGSCRIMVRRAGTTEVAMELACETVTEDGMQITFLSHLDFRSHHGYQIEDFHDPWDVLRHVNEVFPEAAHCRHCGGCDVACPRGIEVQRGVNLAVDGKIVQAGDLFETCVMCNLCTRACPERIGPNHLGLLCRRLTAAHTLRPANLMLRLEQLRKGELAIDTEGP